LQHSTLAIVQSPSSREKCCCTVLTPLWGFPSHRIIHNSLVCVCVWVCVSVCDEGMETEMSEGVHSSRSTDSEALVPVLPLTVSSVCADHISTQVSTYPTASSCCSTEAVRISGSVLWPPRCRASPFASPRSERTTSPRASRTSRPISCD
jgi:hypothetical protein